MPEIEITPEQEERLRALQEDIARDVVGKYGHVRPRDAVEYLLDRYEDEMVEADVHYGEDGNERAYVLFEDNTPTTYTSNNLQDRLSFIYDVQNALDNNNLGGSDNGDDEGISSWMAGLGGFVVGIIAVMGVGFLLLVLYLVGRITSVA